MIILYGGSFDPIHIGHMIVAHEVYQSFRPDRFILMPARQNPLKVKRTVATNQERLDMLKLAAAVLEFGEVSDMEINRTGDSYTYDTVLELSRYDEDIVVIIGTDQYVQLNRWHRIDELKKLCRFIVVNRETEENQVTAPDISFHIPRIDISATEIRRRLTEGATVKFWLHPEIEAFVRKEQIYEKEKSH
ncbi:nicotinate-nucleotide adenylyltransferase [Macrococcus equipercicus]|uniref:Probable nicotinate-nucleotide adenylyltransferase n=1 Tax=Macrococcus equipercicus TaxID=69967 RepID=A0A9Q9F0M2_9STAP|nr:nicotinate-nucleotide adenylyltransferase [Macrococcus equipercicus]UTH13002.1 nicotinate-nucleotide adenylyltransferase [Macrococcus equipercicus]